MNTSEADQIIARLGLQPLEPEGGYFVRTWEGPSLWSTAIYFLLTRETFSAFHRLQADELWHFYAGDPVEHWQLRESNSPICTVLGSSIFEHQQPQLVVPASQWQAARLLSGGLGNASRGWSLLGCTMCPGWRDDLFQLAPRSRLLAAFPDQEPLIISLTREDN